MPERKGFMHTIASGIVKSRRFIFTVFAALMVFSVFSIGWIRVEDDIAVYLPETAEAKRGLTIMEREFTTFASARVMVNGVEEPEAQMIADHIASLDGVYMVSYDGASRDSYRDGSALYNITFKGTGTDQISKDAMEEIREYLGDRDAAVYSASFDTLNAVLVEEMAGVLVIVVIVVLAVLLFTSSTYGEVLVLVATFLAAAITNMGTNFLLGTISLISNAVTLVMQLALSVDYAIIFCNRYKEEHTVLPVEEAAVSALAKSIPEISASSLTTIAGLAAMTFMQFRLGADMGIVLIKSIVFSLLTVFLFMPAMLVFCGRLMDKTAHRNFVPKVSFLGKFAHATRYIIPPIFAALVILGFVGYGRSHYGYSMDIIEKAHQNEMDIAQKRIEEQFGKNNMIAVLVPAGDYEKERSFAEELSCCYEVNSVMGLAGVEVMDGRRLTDYVDYRQVMELADVDETAAKAIVAYAAAGREDFREAAEDLEDYSVPLIDLFMALYDVAEKGDYELQPEQLSRIRDLYDQLSLAKKQLQSDKHSCIVLYVDLPLQSEETFAFLDRIHSIADQYYDEVVLTGDAVSAKDFARTFESDNRIVSTLSIVLVMLILLLTFRSVGMPILLILVIQGSIWLNFAIPAAAGDYVFFMCFLIVGAIQMGANIDYAIVISSRYTELRQQDISPAEAITDALNLAFPTVITSGSMMVAAGLMIGARVSQCVIAGMGKYVGTGTAISLVLVNFALPQILLFGDGFAKATTIRISGKRPGSDAAKIIRRAVGIALAGTVVFTAAVIPLGLRRSEAALCEAEEQTDYLLERTRALRTIADELTAEKRKLDSTKMGFAEHLLTEEIGSKQLEEGRELYKAGVAELEEYKALLESGEEEYRRGVEQYEDGLARYYAGQRALEAGQKEYDEGVKAYEAGTEELAKGQIEYDLGSAGIEAAKILLREGELLYKAGEAELVMAEAEYAAAQETANAVELLYGSVVPLYNTYKELESRLAAMEASEDADPLELARLRMEAGAAWLAYESAQFGLSVSQIIADREDAAARLAAAEARVTEVEEKLAKAQTQLDEGYAGLAEAEEQLAAGKAELEAGQARLDEAEAQLRAAEAELEDGKAELIAGEAELAAAKAKLDAARKELDEGAEEIREGEEELADAGKELEAGMETLNQNRKNLQDDMSALDELNDNEEKLESGMSILRGVRAIDSIAGYSATEAEVCAAAESYFEDQLQSICREGRLMKFVSVLLLASALAALAGLVLWVLKKYRAAALFAIPGTLGGLAGTVLWWMGCRKFGMLIFWAALLLTAFSVAAAEILIRLGKRMTK